MPKAEKNEVGAFERQLSGYRRSIGCAASVRRSMAWNATYRWEHVTVAWQTVRAMSYTRGEFRSANGAGKRSLGTVTAVSTAKRLPGLSVNGAVRRLDGRSRQIRRRQRLRGRVTYDVTIYIRRPRLWTISFCFFIRYVFALRIARGRRRQR